MSTPKDKIIPGVKVLVDNKGKGLNSPVVLMEEPGSYLSGYYEPAVGEELEVVAKPRKYRGINVVKVKYKGLVELFVYYTTLRYSTTPVVETGENGLVAE